MLSLLQQSVYIPQVGSDSCENNKKTDLEWASLLNYSQSAQQQQPRMKNDCSMSLHTDKKFEKDSQGMWVWYKNQLLSNNYKPIYADEINKYPTDTFVKIKCFAVFSNNQILDVKLEGTTFAKINRDKTADLRSIRLTQTVNSLNCRYFLFTVTAYQSCEGEEEASYAQLEQRIANSNQLDEIRQKVLKNTLISQCISIQTRKKSLHQRVSLLCQLHPFVPNEFTRLLQMLHGENPEEILSSDIRGLYFYFSNKKIRHKIFHPFYLAARFHQSVKLYYNDEDNSNSDLSDVFLKIQKDVEQTLLLDTSDDEGFTNQKKKNQKNINAKLIMQIISKKSASTNDSSCQKSSKTSNQEQFRSKVINYLLPLQSNAIKIVGDDSIIPPYFKQINYDEEEYQQAYTQVFPKILNTLFEYQEKRSQYPSYLFSVGYSAQKEDVSDFMKIVSKGNKMQSIKYRSELEQKYDEKHRNKLLKVPVYSDNQIYNKNCPLVFKDQPSLNQFTSSNKQNINSNYEDQTKDVMINQMILNMCNNMQETNRKSYTSNTSETVGIQQNVNIQEGKQKKYFDVSDLKGLLPCREDNNSQLSDDTHDDNGLEYFTSGENKKKIKLNNYSLNNNINTSKNNITLSNKNSLITEYKNQDQTFYPQNINNTLNSNQIFKLNEVKIENLMKQSEVGQQKFPLELSDYQNLISQLSQQQSNSSILNNTQIIQNQLLPINLQQVNLQDMLINTQQNQILQQNKQQLLNTTTNQNNLLSLLQNPSISQENLYLNNNAYSLLQNFNNSIQQQAELQQNQLGEQLLSQIKQNNQITQSIEQQLLIQQILKEQYLLNNSSYQAQGIPNDNFNQFNLINQAINQNNNVNLNIRGITDLLYPEQNSIQFKQQFSNQQQQIQKPLIQQQFVQNNMPNTQFDNQRIADIFQQMMMSQYQ